MLQHEVTIKVGHRTCGGAFHNDAGTDDGFASGVNNRTRYLSLCHDGGRKDCNHDQNEKTRPQRADALREVCCLFFHLINVWL